MLRSDLQLNCNSPSVTLDGSGSGSGTYSWTGPNGFTSSVQSPSVSVAGTYTLTVTGSGGCQASDDVVVTSDPNQPTVDAGADQTISCLVASVTLDGSNSDPGTYSWTGPNGFTSSAVSPTVTVVGSYTLEITLGNGCSATDVVTVIDDTNAPSADAGPDQIIGCNNNSVFLDGTGTDPGSVSWSGPGGFTSVAINPTVSVAGVYTVTVTGSNGCSDSDDVTVTEDTTLPLVDAGKDVDIDCSTGTAILDGSDSDPGTYSWTGPNGFTSSSISPSVSVSGTYTLTVTGANGCVDSDDAIVSDCAVSCNGNAVTILFL